MMHHVCHTHFPHHHSSAKSWQIILNVTGIPISISTSNGKNPLGKCSQPAVLHMYITLCWSSRFWPLKARRKPQFLIAYDVDFWSRLVPWRVHPTRTWSMKDLGNPRITHESTWDSNDETSEILSNCCFVYLNAEKCLLRRRRSRELDENLEGKDLFCRLFVFICLLVKKCLALGQRLRIWPQMQDTGQSAPSIISLAFFFGGTVQSKVPGSWVWSAPSRAFAQKLIQCWWSGNFGPMIYYFHYFPSFLPLWFCMLKSTRSTQRIGAVFFLDSGPSRDLRPLPFFA